MKFYIKDLGIVRRYGFNDGGFMIVEVRQGRGKKKFDIRLYDRSSWVEGYAMENGIKSEDDLHKLINKEITDEDMLEWIYQELEENEE